LIVGVKAEPAQGYGLPHRLVQVAPTANSRSRQAQPCHFDFTRSDANQRRSAQKVLKKQRHQAGRSCAIEDRLVAPRSTRPADLIFDYLPHHLFAPMTK
jgi:hypothetical protein